MNRISLKFKKLRKQKKKALIVYIMAGDPTLSATERLVLALEKAGADIIELGVAFSDPIADGAIIQAAGKRALEAGATLGKVFNLAKKLRRKTQIPLVLMLYYNLILHMGEKRFVKSCQRCGVDGVIIPDLPVEEAKTLIKLSKACGVATIFFVTPTSNKKRMKHSVQAASGFIYYISRTGVTGAATKFSKELRIHVRQIKRATNKPVCVGFGIRSRQQIALIQKIADGAIVGSAVVEKISRYTKSPKLIENVTQFVRRLRA
jgi:tryptophan synthase alpha chain